MLVTLAGCQYVFPLRDEGPNDAPPDPDAPRPLVPPDGSTACDPAPDFATWTFGVRTIAGSNGQILNPTFTGTNRVMFTSAGKLYESTLVGPPVEVAALELGDGSEIRFPVSTPDGQMIWFTRFSLTAPSSGLYYALRSGDAWTAERADFEITAYQIVPGNVAFYSGTARMITALTPMDGERLRLVELSSVDGLHWTRLETLPFSDGAIAGDFDPTLSSDGCFVVFRRLDKVYVSSRELDGTFQSMTEIPNLSGKVDPALAPSGDRLWMVESSGLAIFEGVAP